jgi:hypothetical protein
LAKRASADRKGKHRRKAVATSSAALLGDYWPGIQIYYPPVKYAPSLGIYEDLEQAAQRFKKHAVHTNLKIKCFLDLTNGFLSKEYKNLAISKYPLKHADLKPSSFSI